MGSMSGPFLSTFGRIIMKKKLDIVKIVKHKSRDVFNIPTTKKFKDKKKYNRKQKHKGVQYE